MKCVDHKGGHSGAPPAIGEHIVLYFGEDPARFERVFCDSFPGFTTRPTHLGEEII
jgi:hypothetical protein